MTKKVSFLTIAVFAIFALYFARVRTAGDTADTYWHLAVGRQVWEQKQIPQTDDFVFGKDDTHYTSTEWLSGLIFFLFVKYLGFNGLAALRVLCGLGILYFAYKSFSLFTKDETLKLAAITFCGYVLAIRLFDRPEIFSLLFVAIINYACIGYFFSKKFNNLFFLLPPIFLLWPNIHAFAVYGFGLFSFWLLVITFEKVGKINIRHKFNFILATYFLSVLFLLIQLKRFLFFLQLKKLTSFSVNEWGSLKDRVLITGGYHFFSQMPIEVYFYVFLITAFCALALLKIKEGRTVGISKLLIILGYFFSSLASIRYYRLIPLSVLTIIPITVWLLSVHENKALKTVYYFLLGFVLLLTVGSIFLGFTIGSKSYLKASQDENGKTIGVKARLWGQVFPQKASQVISENLTTRHLFTFDWWSNYFIWQNPSVKTYSDVMYQYRTQEDFKDEQTLSSGGENWQALLDKYDIDTVVNSQFAAVKGNNTPVWELPNWKLIYVDNISALWARDDVIKNLPVDLSALDLQIQEPLKFKPENKDKALQQLKNLLALDPQNDFARGQLIQNYIDEENFEEAKKLAEQSRTIAPNDPTFSIYLAAVYASSGNCQLAAQFANESLAKSYNDYNFVALKKNILANCQKSF